jgi:hypothetical protein
LVIYTLEFVRYLLGYLTMCDSNIMDEVTSSVASAHGPMRKSKSPTPIWDTNNSEKAIMHANEADDSDDRSLGNYITITHAVDLDIDNDVSQKSDKKDRYQPYQTAKSYMRSMFGTTRPQTVETPAWLHAMLDTVYHFDNDPCPPNHTLDGLQVEWGASNFVNPPYKNLYEWLKKGVQEKTKGNLSVFLLPVRTHQLYFHEFVLPHASKLVFFKGPLTFKGYTRPSPFSVYVVVYDPHWTKPLQCVGMVADQQRLTQATVCGVWRVCGGCVEGVRS